MRDPMKKVMEKLGAELNKWCNIVYASFLIAMHRHWGWGQLRLTRFMQMIEDTWKECASTNMVSMIQMLYEETTTKKQDGIEIQIGNGRSWRELAYLNAKIDMDIRNMSVPQSIYMRNRQIEWIPAQVTACALLALRRRAGFGYVRLTRVMSQVVMIQQEFGCDQAAIVEACRRETGINVIKEERHE